MREVVKLRVFLPISGDERADARVPAFRLNDFRSPADRHVLELSAVGFVPVLLPVVFRTEDEIHVVGVVLDVAAAFQPGEGRVRVLLVAGELREQHHAYPQLHCKGFQRLAHLAEFLRLASAPHHWHV